MKYYIVVKFVYSELTKSAGATEINCGFFNGFPQYSYQLDVNTTPSLIFNSLVKAAIDNNYSKIRHILKDDLGFNSDAYELEVEKYIR